MPNQIEIYQSQDGQTQIEVKFEEEIVWFNRNQLADLFGPEVKIRSKHAGNVFLKENWKSMQLSQLYATTAAEKITR